ncbi:MAG: hypothetical protein A2X48_05105 [Lentisphaerae bacterium GWF2_49_21]|nr:MAG: hypothetical protein A2X48_05105 [Lentisphaerae bacterium GWF2_49_21]
MKSYIFISLILIFCISAVAQDVDKQKTNLPDPKGKARFEIKDRDWPAKFAEASVCLWKNDAIGALSITIDDNCAPDHEWWTEMGKKYDFNVTWFVIASTVSGSNAGFCGTWEGFAKLLKLGHDIQSHSLTHLNQESPEWKDINMEYEESQKRIEKNIPGHKAVVLAYPGGKNSNLNDSAVAVKYYIGARGTTGSVNATNKTSYLNTASMSGVICYGDAKWESQDLKSALEKGFAKNKDLYRAWYCCHFHQAKPEVRSLIEKQLALVSEKAKAGELWIGLFKDVVKYGQERDTAVLNVKESSPDKIVISLTDEMKDQIFDYPLTVKVRLDPSWKSLKAEQGGKKADCRIVEKDGAVYGIVEIVPDKGDAVISK